MGPTVTADEDMATPICASCRAPLRPDALFCAECGAQVATAYPGPTTPAAAVVITSPEPPAGTAGEGRRSGRPTWLLVVGYACALLVIIALGSTSGYLLANRLLVEPAEGQTSQPSGDTAPSNETTSTTDGSDSDGGGGTTTSTGPPTPVDLSTLAQITTSSQLAPKSGSTYEPGHLVDGDPTSAWAEGARGYGEGEWVLFTFPSVVEIKGIRVIAGYDKQADGWDRWDTNGRLRRIRIETADGAAEDFTLEDRRDEQLRTLRSPVRTTELRMTILEAYEATSGSPHNASDTSVSEFHVWGLR